MRAWLLLLIVAVVPACGQRQIRVAGPLPPEAWAIAEDDRPAPGQHVRYLAPTPGRFGGLDVAVTEYKPGEGTGPAVLLVGVVHIADAVYYQQVQKVLDACPVVLFEAIKPRDLDLHAWWEAAQREERFATALQNRIASWLGMRYQLDALDYSHPRFVHADMDAEAFAEAGGADLLPGFGKGGVAPEAEALLEQLQSLGDVVFGQDSPFQTMARVAFAKALGDEDLVATIEMHPELGALILDRRNEVALSVLEPYLHQPEGPVAVFYGAAHMTGMEKALTGEHGYVRTAARWYRAWALRKPLVSAD
jgi:hypothetical protein